MRSSVDNQHFVPTMTHSKSGCYEFGGPAGAFGVSFGLPILIYLFTFLCNDISGCPSPSILSTSQFSIDHLKHEVGWPVNGVWGLSSWDVFVKVLGYYLFNAMLHRVLPGQEVEGTELSSGGKLHYKLNSWSSAILTLAICAVGTAIQGTDFAVWNYIFDNYVQILTANIIIAFVLATYVYACSFTVKQGNKEKRELAAGGNSGNVLYDWFIGRELNPRARLPLLGEIDIKLWCELRPGMLGWLLLDLTFVAHQYKTFGFISDSIALVTLFHTLYVLDAYWMEPAALTTMDITSDGFGFMLAFGDLVWLPFVYSFQARYLASYPFNLGTFGTISVLAILGLGYYIFRSANNEKNRFRVNPLDPRVRHLKYLETKSGSKLLTSGWWGKARHINYLGDWIMAWAYCLPTGISGFVVRQDFMTAGENFTQKGISFIGSRKFQEPYEVTQGEARGYGMVFTYFYLVYFAILLIHREMRDEEKCKRKYGDDWRKYCKIVPYRFIPGIF
ncbi:BgTH12-02835 [Blumeria graminis f. sp. triticale]|uniref:Delta(14)-sterol reductase n=1 Tax=Blumeria graminis f. sp. triticale TaxID=1689686 RepID=A0A9W4GF38_BLUGR|nr:BgTH12-02835 [Blumeria graminis f. sp. triticale]